MAKAHKSSISPAIFSTIYPSDRQDEHLALPIINSAEIPAMRRKTGEKGQNFAIHIANAFCVDERKDKMCLTFG